MIVIRNSEDVSSISNPCIHALLALRLQQLGTFHDGLLIVVEVGDSVEELEAVSGVAILHDTFEDVPFGHPDFTPSFDFVIDHGAAYEMHFDVSDDGIGTTFVVPKGDGIDACLLSLCREFAVTER
jgi:hypothetical protein